MVYAAKPLTMQNFAQTTSRQQAPNSYRPVSYSQSPVASNGHAPNLLDPALLKAARHLYRTFYEANPDVAQRPSGVALNRYHHRGKLIFGRKPILLPQECFIPFEQVQAELY